MTNSNGPGLAMQYILWLTDRDLARLISSLGNQVLFEACQSCDPKIRHRILAQLSDYRREQVIHGGPWGNSATDEVVTAARKYIECVADDLLESGEIGVWYQRYTT